MPTCLGKTILSLLVLLSAFVAQGQYRRVVTYQTVVNGTHLVEASAYTFDSVDDQPHFPGGDGAMMKFINRERKYPQAAYSAGIQGRVLCSFIVSADGKISNVEVLRGVEESLNAEAVRVIERMPKWVAGRVEDATVPVYCILAIPFRL